MKYVNLIKEYMLFAFIFAQLKLHSHFSSEILHFWIGFKKPLSRSGSSLLNNNGNLSAIQLIFSD